MSVGNDLVTVAKDAQAVYKAAKKLKKDLKAEAKVAKKDIDNLKALHTKLKQVTKNLPDALTVAERKRLVANTKKLIDTRLKEQDATLDLPEREKLNTQSFVLNNQLLKLQIMQNFNVKELIDNDRLESIAGDIADAQRQIRKQMKAQGYVLESLQYNNAFFVRRDIAAGKFADQSTNEAYERGYRTRSDRKELFPWNHDMEDLLQATPDEVIKLLHQRWRPHCP